MQNSQVDKTHAQSVYGARLHKCPAASSGAREWTGRVGAGAAWRILAGGGGPASLAGLVNVGKFEVKAPPSWDTGTGSNPGSPANLDLKWIGEA